MTKSPDDLELRSEEARDFLTAPPKWLVRRGTGILFITLIAILSLSWLVKYPDVLSARVTLSTLQPPIPIVAKTAGSIVEVLWNDSSTVKSGEIVAVIDNSAYYKDVLKLEEALDILLLSSSEGLLQRHLPRGGRIGDLLSPYSEVLKNQGDFAFYAGNQNSIRLEDDYLQQIVRYKELNDTILQQVGILQKQLDLAKINYERTKKLIAEKAEAPVKLEEEEKVLIRLQGEQKGLSEKLATNQLRITEIKKEIGDARFDGIENIAEKQRVFRESLLNLKSSIERWKQIYLLVAPSSGVLTFNLKGKLLHSFVGQNQVVFTVIPSNENASVIAEGTLPGQNSGKAEVGNRVRLKLDGYNYREKGVLEGVVSEIAPIFDSDGNTRIKIALTNGLETNFHISIPFRHGMPATAEIVTEERRLLERLFAF